MLNMYLVTEVSNNRSCNFMDIIETHEYSSYKMALKKYVEIDDRLKMDINIKLSDIDTGTSSINDELLDHDETMDEDDKAYHSKTSTYVYTNDKNHIITLILQPHPEWVKIKSTAIAVSNILNKGGVSHILLDKIGDCPIHDKTNISLAITRSAISFENKDDDRTIEYNYNLSIRIRDVLPLDNGDIKNIKAFTFSKNEKGNPCIHYMQYPLGFSSTNCKSRSYDKTIEYREIGFHRYDGADYDQIYNLINRENDKPNGLLMIPNQLDRLTNIIQICATRFVCAKAKSVKQDVDEYGATVSNTNHITTITENKYDYTDTLWNKILE